jgi:predicted nucleic acid-binding protein
LIAALLRDGVTRRIIKRLPASLITVEQALRTVVSYREELSRRANVDADAFDIILGSLMLSFDVIPQIEYNAWLPTARRLMGDPEDVPFLALALAKGAPIWTDDRHFRRQNVVRVISTAELVAQSHANGCG